MIKLFTKEEYNKAKSRDLLKLQCKNCKSQFYKNKKEIRPVLIGIPTNKTCEFCSAKCSINYRNPPILVKCKCCNKEFKKTQTNINKSPNHFCSRSCAAKINNLKPKRIKKDRFCKKCNIKITKDTRTLCDNCLNTVDWSTIKFGELKGRYKYQKHSRIRDLARSKFDKVKKECVICGYSKSVHVAHIKAVNSFSKDTPISEINDLSNLVLLCPNHHYEFDHGLIQLPS